MPEYNLSYGWKVNGKEKGRSSYSFDEGTEETAKIKARDFMRGLKKNNPRHDIEYFVINFKRREVVEKEIIL